MMLYTIYPLELVFAEDDEKAEAQMTMEVEGVKLIVEAAGTNHYKKIVS
ncbi:YlzJ-like family protein [Terrilactibacillus sp. S3-3]|nr:YlzJ-like family protein [Terrilactibacillus sp. S3-3]